MVAINTTWMLSVQGTVADCTHIHTLHFLAKADSGTPENLISAWQGAPYTNYRAMFSNEDANCQVIKAVQVCGTLPLAAGAETVLTPGPANGTRAPGSQREPSFIAASVREMTAFSGKSYRGRYFIGGLQDGDVERNFLAASYLTLVSGYNSALFGMFGPGGTDPNWQLFVHSRKLAEGPGQCQSFGAVVTSLVTNPRVTTMRSRKLGHGT